MNQTPSTEFRRAFPRLAKATQVTWNGRVIGTWFPVGTKVDPRREISPFSQVQEAMVHDLVHSNEREFHKHFGTKPCRFNSQEAFDQ
jgi:hypothetical protein